MEAASVNRYIENLTPESGGFALVSGELHQISAAIGKLEGLMTALQRSVDTMNADVSSMRASVSKLEPLLDRVTKLEKIVDDLRLTKTKIVGGVVVISSILTAIASFGSKLLHMVFAP